MAREQKMPSLPNASAPAEVNPDVSEHDEMIVPPTPPPPKAMPKPIEVMAIRPGFYAPHRKNPGDIFTVPSFKKLGSWMKCTDPKIEREHQANQTKLRRAANSQEDNTADD